MLCGLCRSIPVKIMPPVVWAATGLFFRALSGCHPALCILSPYLCSNGHEFCRLRCDSLSPLITPPCRWRSSHGSGIADKHKKDLKTGVHCCLRRHPRQQPPLHSLGEHAESSRGRPALPPRLLRNFDRRLPWFAPCPSRGELALGGVDPLKWTRDVGPSLGKGLHTFLERQHLLNGRGFPILLTHVAFFHLPYHSSHGVTSHATLHLHSLPSHFIHSGQNHLLHPRFSPIICG